MTEPHATSGRSILDSVMPSSNEPVSSRRPVFILLGVMAGVFIAQLTVPVYILPWLCAAGIGAVIAIIARLLPPSRTGTVITTASAIVALIALSVAWTVVREYRVSSDDVTSLNQSQTMAFHFAGRVESQPAIRSPQRGAFSPFGYQEPVTVFRATVSSLIDSQGKRRGATGRVLVRIGEPDYALSVGQRIEAFGIWRPFMPAMNPGDTDRAEIARIQGLSGIVDIASRNGVVRAEASQSENWWWALRRWQSEIRLRASGWIRQDLPDTEDTRREALLAAILLGDRGAGLDGLDESFKRVGLAHLLAISGLHLGILTISFVFLLRLLTPSPLLARVLIFVLVVVYLFLVPARIPVWRAGLMVIAFTIASARGRRLDALNVWALAATALLLWHPSELLSPGAQLSFGIVLAFIVLGRAMRERLWGEPADTEKMSAPEYVVDCLKTFVAINVLAFLVSLPVVAYHFGVYCLIAPIAALVGAPLATLTLAVGYVKIVTAAVFPSLGAILGPALALCADALIGLVDRLDHWPGSSLPIVYPGVGWTMITLVAIVWWIRWPLRFPRRPWMIRLRILLLALLLIWPLRGYAPSLTTAPNVAAQMHMIAVGDGSSVLFRSDGQAALFDAGSGSHFEIGADTIVPTLRRIGVFRLDIVYLSHPDLDHFSGLLDVVDEMRVRRVAVSPLFLRDAKREPFGPHAFVLSQLEQRGVEIMQVKAGDTARIGHVMIEFLHPKEDDEYERSNEASNVVLATVASRRILLTGDLQAAGMDNVLNRFGSDRLRADILELPHHGSFSEQAVAFVETVDPQYVLQSTGASRLRGDRWIVPLQSRDRFMTARDGMITVRVYKDGGIDVEAHLDER